MCPPCSYRALLVLEYSKSFTFRVHTCTCCANSGIGDSFVLTSSTMHIWPWFWYRKISLGFYPCMDKTVHDTTSLHIRTGCHCAPVTCIPSESPSTAVPHNGDSRTQYFGSMALSKAEMQKKLAALVQTCDADNIEQSDDPDRELRKWDYWLAESETRAVVVEGHKGWC